MKETMCNQCEGIVCADTTDGKRYITQNDKMADGRWIEFPQTVQDCPIRRSHYKYYEDGTMIRKMPDRETLEGFLAHGKPTVVFNRERGEFEKLD